MALFRTFLRNVTFLSSPWVPGRVHLPVHRPYTPSVHHRVEHSAMYVHGSHRAQCTFTVSSGRIRWYLDRSFPAENVKVRLRLDRQGAKSTCVCQAKLLKRIKTEFYSSRQKGHLPQMGSFSGPPAKAYSKGKAEC